MSDEKNIERLLKQLRVLITETDLSAETMRLCLKDSIDAFERRRDENRPKPEFMK